MPQQEDLSRKWDGGPDLFPGALRIAAFIDEQQDQHHQTSAFLPAIRQIHPRPSQEEADVTPVRCDRVTSHLYLRAPP